MRSIGLWKVARGRRLAAALIGCSLVAAVTVCGAAPREAGALIRAGQFSQRLVASGGGGDPLCRRGTQSGGGELVCRPSEVAPSDAQRSLEVTAAGHAMGSVVVTDDGFGSGRPVLSVRNGRCPADVELEDGAQEQVGARAEFLIRPRDGSPRTVSAVLARPQAAQFLRKGEGREVFSLPVLEQPMATEEPVDLGMVNPGDRITLRLLAVGAMTSCEDGQLRHQPLEADLWGPGSTQAAGYLTTPQPTDARDDTKIAPFKAVATISY